MSDHDDHPDHPDHTAAARLLRTATDGLPTDVDRVVAAGTARGRAVRRRRGLQTTLAAVAVVGVIGVAASVGPGALDGDSGPDRGAGVATGGPDHPVPPTIPPRVPGGPSTIAVAAREVPAVVAGLLPGVVGAVRTEPDYPLVDQPRRKVVHFDYDGTLATFDIVPADSVPACADQVDADSAVDGTCVTVDGTELLTTGPTTADRVTAQGVSAWRLGYVVTAISYDATEGKDVDPLSDGPAISLEQLTELVTSDVWFGGVVQERRPGQVLGVLGTDDRSELLVMVDSCDGDPGVWVGETETEVRLEVTVDDKPMRDCADTVTVTLDAPVGDRDVVVAGEPVEVEEP
jgi:hypothetical protein